MCKSNFCIRKGCENNIPENRNDNFCSHRCKKHHKAMKFGALISSYQELPIDSMSLEINTKKSIKKTCKYNECGNTIKRRGKKVQFCSPECYAKYRTKKRSCSLIGCKKDFVPYRNSMQFCSRTCYLKSVQVNRLCLRCDKKLSTRNKKKYCSLECVYEHKFDHSKNHDTCQRAGCAKKLTDRRSSRKFCSQDCYKAIRSERKQMLGRTKLVNRKSWEYPRRFIKTPKGWKLLSSVVWEQNNGPIPPNHIVWFKDNNSFNDEDISNLVLLSNIDFRRLNAKRRREGVISDEKFHLQDYVVI